MSGHFGDYARGGSEYGITTQLVAMNQCISMTTSSIIY